MLAGLNPLDGLRLLETHSADDRLALLAELLGDEIELARARLSG